MGGREGLVLAVMTGLDAYQTALLAGLRDELGSRGVALLAHVQDEHDRDPIGTLRRLLQATEPIGVVTTNSLVAAQEHLLLSLLRRRGSGPSTSGRTSRTPFASARGTTRRCRRSWPTCSMSAASCALPWSAA